LYVPLDDCQELWDIVQKILIDNSPKNAMIIIERFRRNLSMILKLSPIRNLAK
jgi:hypothetical protein